MWADMELAAKHSYPLAVWIGSWPFCPALFDVVRRLVVSSRGAWTAEHTVGHKRPHQQFGITATDLSIVDTATENKQNKKQQHGARL